MANNQNEKLLLFDFSNPSAMAQWSSINDAVMGGVSEGGIRWKDGCQMVFAGSISFENSGGFSSIRSNGDEYDLSAYKGLVITAMGDGKRYKFTLRTDLSYDGVSFQNHFESRAGEVADYYLPFEGFHPSYHGKILEGHPPLDTSIIKRFGFIIANRQEGPFSLGIHKIQAVS